MIIRFEECKPTFKFIKKQNKTRYMSLLKIADHQAVDICRVTGLQQTEISVNIKKVVW